MPHYSESRRAFLLGTAGLALVGCGGEISRTESTSEIPTEIPFSFKIPALSVQELPPIPNPIIEKPPPLITKDYFSPLEISLYASDSQTPIEEGRWADDNVSLFIPQGGHITDFSRTMEAGRKTMVLAGHSFWQGEICPMGRTFELKNQDMLVIKDNTRGMVTFTVEKRFALNWPKTLKLIYPDKDEGTIVMFTSLRTDKDQNFKQLMPLQFVRGRVDNSEDIDGLYDSKDYLFWVVVSVETPLAQPPEVF